MWATVSSSPWALGFLAAYWSVLIGTLARGGRRG